MRNMTMYFMVLLFYYLVGVSMAGVLVLKMKELFEYDKNTVEILGCIVLFPIVNFIFTIIVIITYLRNGWEYEE